MTWLGTWLGTCTVSFPVDPKSLHLKEYLSYDLGGSKVSLPWFQLDFFILW